MQVVEEAVVKGEVSEGLSKSPAHAVKQSKKNKKKKKKKSKKNRGKIFSCAPTTDKKREGPVVRGNFLLQAAPGCHIIHGINPPKWIVGMDTFFAEDFGLSSDTVEQMPDISIDPESGLLTCVNKHESNIRTFYISVSCKVLDADLKDMEDGMARDIDGNTFSCVTFVVVLPPQALIDICYLQRPLAHDDNSDLMDNSVYKLYSDVQDIPTFQYVPPSRTGKGNALRTARFTDTAAAKPMRLPAPPFAPPFSAISEPDLISEIGPPTSLPLKIER